MSELTKKIDRAYNFLSRITVNDVNVDLMAVARQELRSARLLAEELEEQVRKAATAEHEDPAEVNSEQADLSAVDEKEAEDA